MTSDNCPTCRELSEAALAAIGRHLRLAGKRDVAAIQQDKAALENLRPELAEAEAEREAAVDAYRAHRKAHLAEAESAAV